MSNELHTMPLKVEKFFSSSTVRSMTWDEQGAYLLSLAEAWLKGGLIPGSREAIGRLLKIQDDAILDRIFNNVILQCFEDFGDGKHRFNRHLSEIFDEVFEKSRKFSEAGRRGAEARLKGGSSQASARLQHRSKPGLSNQSQKQKQKQNQNQNQNSLERDTNFEALEFSHADIAARNVSFEKFWEAYPVKKRCNKVESEKAFRVQTCLKLEQNDIGIEVPTGFDKGKAERIVEAARQYAEAKREVPAKYLMDPANWLGAKRYEDAPDSWSEVDPGKKRDPQMMPPSDQKLNWKPL